MNERWIPCPYCDGRAPLVDGGHIYPTRSDLWDLPYYRCDPCDAHVGCHPRTIVPLGMPANAPLRRARSRAHAAFDPIWKRDGRGNKRRRTHAYAWLAAQLGLQVDRTHIGWFDEAMCARVVEVCAARERGEA